MKNTPGRVVILVNNYDDAAAFYENKLGFHKLFDATTNGQRYLHLPPSAGEQSGVWLLLGHEIILVQLATEKTIN